MSRHPARELFALALILLLVPMAARAEVFYTVDVTSDELVRLDSSSLTVTTVGPIGHNFTNAQLAALGGVLYAINTPTGTATTIDLITINHLTGAKTAQVRIKQGGIDLVTTAADALTSNGTTLLLSLHTTSSNPFAAHALGDLAPSGSLTNVTSFAGTNTDMDNLAATPTAIYSLDGTVVSPNNRTDVFLVARPSTYSLEGSHFQTGNDGYTGTVFNAAGELWGWERGAHRLRRVDPSTGAILQNVSFSTTRALRGLAIVSSPVPAVPATWGRIKSIYRS